MEALGRFGLDPVLFVAQLVNFLIIGYIFYRLLIKPLMANIRSRGEAIARGLADAEKARKALEEAAREREKILGQAYTDASRVIADARAEADRVRDGAAERAREEAERILAEARARAALEKEETELALRAHALDLSGHILDSVVGTLFNEEEKSRIVTRGLEQIRKLA